MIPPEKRRGSIWRDRNTGRLCQVRLVGAISYADTNGVRIPEPGEKTWLAWPDEYESRYEFVAESEADFNAQRDPMHGWARAWEQHYGVAP